jgi:hypothetical protein
MSETLQCSNHVVPTFLSNTSRVVRVFQQEGHLTGVFLEVGFGQEGGVGIHCVGVTMSVRLRGLAVVGKGVGVV